MHTWVRVHARTHTNAQSSRWRKETIKIEEKSSSMACRVANAQSDWLKPLETVVCIFLHSMFFAYPSHAIKIKRLVFDVRRMPANWYEMNKQRTTHKNHNFIVVKSNLSLSVSLLLTRHQTDFHWNWWMTRNNNKRNLSLVVGVVRSINETNCWIKCSNQIDLYCHLLFSVEVWLQWKSELDVCICRFSSKLTLRAFDWIKLMYHFRFPFSLTWRIFLFVRSTSSSIPTFLSAFFPFFFFNKSIIVTMNQLKIDYRLKKTMKSLKSRRKIKAKHEIVWFIATHVYRLTEKNSNKNEQKKRKRKFLSKIKQIEAIEDAENQWKNHLQLTTHTQIKP